MASSTDIIHLEVAGDRRGTEKYKFRTNFKPKKQYKKLPYFADPKIVPRVKQYLEDNKDKMYVDIDEMVDELQQKYRDYSKKKRIPFKSVVEKAFSVVLDLYRTRDHNVQDQEESDSSDISDMEIDSEDDLDLIEDQDQANKQVVGMYMQQQAMKKMASAKASMTSNDKELIDLSSDEEEGDVQVSAKSAKLSDSNHSSEHQKSSPQQSSKEACNSHVTSNHTVNNTTHPQPSLMGSNSTVQNNIVPATPVTGKQLLTQPSADKSSRKRKNELIAQNNTKNGEMPRRKRRDFNVQTPCSTFKDVGGCTNVLQEVCKLLIHIRHPEIFEQIGVSPPRGFLLHGPPGCGKTLLANSIAGELGVPLLKVAAPELVAGVSGESEERIRDLFEQAVSLAPCVLFLDEVDAITPNRNNAQREMERRIVAQLLTCLDELGDKEGGNQVLVLGATNRPDALDPALRRAGRFDREVCMGIPDRTARAHILQVVCGRLALAPDVSSDSGMDTLASLTPGFVGADLTALTREAAMVAVNRVFLEIKEQRKSEEKVKAQNSQALEADGGKQLDEEKKTDESKAEANELPEKVMKEQSEEIEKNVEVHLPTSSINVDSDKLQEAKEKSQVGGESNGKAESQTEAASEKTSEGEGSRSEVLAGGNAIDEKAGKEIVPEGIDAKSRTSSGKDELAVPKENGNKDENVSLLDSKSDESKDPALQEKVEDSIHKDKVEAAQEELQIIVQENRGEKTNQEGSEIEIIAQEKRGEKRKEEERDSLPNKKSKSDDEVEVLEVDMEANAKSDESQIASRETSSQKTDDNSIMLVEEAVNGVCSEAQEGVMLLSKQLGSFPGWTPELCEMVSWLQDTPPLSTAQLSNLHVTMADFHEALRHVQPSAKREGFATVPDVTWDDVGSLSDVRSELQIAILAPVRYPDQFQKLGLNAPTGILLCGPPGCGKTLLAKAIANEAGINFISVKGPELLNMYVGESERAVRQVFQRARSSAPCVIFFDELDALCPKRSDSGDNGVSSRVVNQLLTEMDGVEGRCAVFIMAATNRPDIIDPAVIRPGRLDKILYVGLPSPDDRIDILRALTKNGSKPTLAPDVNLAELAQMPVCDGYTGADLASLVREAGMHALRECISAGGDLKSDSLAVAKRHFISAMAKIRPSVTDKDKKHYEKLKQIYTAVPQPPVQAMDVS